MWKNSSNKYQPTLKIMALAQKVADRFEIRRMAKPHMHRLSMLYKETINLGLFKNQEIVHIDKIDSLEVLRWTPHWETRPRPTARAWENPF